MNRFMQKWTIVSLLEPTQTGYDFHYTNWPRHITVIDTFSFEGSLSNLFETIRTAATNQRPIILQPTHTTYFGASEPRVKVQLFQNSSDLVLLHTLLITQLEHFGITFNHPEFTGSGFIAHESIKDTSIQQARDVVLNNLALVDMFPGRDGYGRKIVKIEPFSTQAVGDK